MDFYPGDPVSNPIRDVGFFFKLCIISYLRIFIFARWGLVRETYSHKNDIIISDGCIMSLCTTHSFENWKVGLADHMVHSVY